MEQISVMHSSQRKKSFLSSSRMSFSAADLKPDLKPVAIKDPFCDPDNPVVVQWKDVEKAMENIKKSVIRTPFKKTRLSDKLGMSLYFKKEFMQYTGSFKDRGSLNSLLNLDESKRFPGVITASAGNHAQGLAYAGTKLNIPVTVVMPETTPLVKVNSCRKLDATIHLRGQIFDEAYRYAMESKGDLIYINGFDHPDVISGQGTIGIEMLEDVPDLDYIIIPVGGGGLLAGIAVAVKHLRPQTKIIAVESELCPSWSQAVTKGHPVVCERKSQGPINSIADGLSVLKVGCNAFATVGHSLHKIVTVTEDLIALAILRLLENDKALVEGAGAAGFAAILSEKLPELQGKKVGCILCGGNIDVALLGRLIDRALALEGRLCRVTCTIVDKAGQLALLASLIGSTGANIKEVLHERLFMTSEHINTVINFLVETRDEQHAEELHELLERAFGATVHWNKRPKTPLENTLDFSTPV